MTCDKNKNRERGDTYEETDQLISCYHLQNDKLIAHKKKQEITKLISRVITNRVQIDDIVILSQ